MKICRVCGYPISSWNRHRNRCYDCVGKYRALKKGAQPIKEGEKK